ncbi:50S ribosomal protein L19, partial [Candidatus Microgenomates bacterium]|nr:50S ribosomal protein L19 [Candidatus Microgenomates bacterium]
MQEVITKFEQKYMKSRVPQIRSGDSVRVHQTISEKGKE